MAKTTAKAKNKNLVTQDGYDKILAELEERKTKIRTDIANKLQTATEQGDLSENAAYKSALEEKELNESRIEELEKVLSELQITTENDNDPSAGIGDVVILKREGDNKKFEYTLVGKSESDPANNMISIESPVGKAVYGKHRGDKVTVSLPSGKFVYTIENIK